MGKFKGPFSTPSGDLYDEARQWVSMLQQHNAPLVDVLLNSFFTAGYTAMRRVIQNALGPAGSPFAKFQVKEASAGGAQVNNFRVVGGTTGQLVDGGVSTKLDHEGPARFFLGGHVALLPSDREWTSNSTVRPPIHSTVTAAAGSVLTDTSAFFLAHGASLVGRICYPNIALTNDDTGVAPVGFPITSVTDDNSIVLDTASPKNADGTAFSNTPIAMPTNLPDVGVVAGSFYRFDMSSVAASRVDTVILDVYEDEADPDDDPLLSRTINGTTTPSSNARVVRQRVEVLEDVNAVDSPPPIGDSPLYYERKTDRDGNVHHRVALATISRDTDSPAIITDSEITDLEAASNKLWALTFGTLPPTTVDSTIFDTEVDSPEDQNSSGVTTAPGQYGGETIEIPRLLLQMLGNVSDDQNRAFQNAGDYSQSAGVLKTTVAGDPGVGDGSYKDSPNTGRHVSLLSNDEQGAILEASGVQMTDAQYYNCFLTKNGHLGSAAGHPSGTPPGSVSVHSSLSGATWSLPETTFHAARTIGNAQSMGFPVIVGVGYAALQDTNTDGYPLQAGEDPAIPNDASGTFVNLGVPILNINLSLSSAPGGGAWTLPSNIAAHYTVIPTVCMAGGMGAGSGQDWEGSFRVTGWSVVGSDLSVRFDATGFDFQHPHVMATIYLISKAGPGDPGIAVPNY